jgi:hypothetical protein
MREQDMRERVERFLKAAFRTRVLPAALGVGVSLTSSCRAHVSPDSGPSVTSETESSSVAKLVGPTDSGGSEAKAAIHEAPDAGCSRVGDAAQPDPFPHSLLRVPAADARPGRPGLTAEPGMLERRLKKTTAIYSAPVYDRSGD